MAWFRVNFSFFLRNVLSDPTMSFNFLSESPEFFSNIRIRTYESLPSSIKELFIRDFEAISLNNWIKKQTFKIQCLSKSTVYIQYFAFLTFLMRFLRNFVKTPQFTLFFMTIFFTKFLLSFFDLYHIEKIVSTTILLSQKF